MLVTGFVWYWMAQDQRYLKHELSFILDSKLDAERCQNGKRSFHHIRLPCLLNKRYRKDKLAETWNPLVCTTFEAYQKGNAYSYTYSSVRPIVVKNSLWLEPNKPVLLFDKNFQQGICVNEYHCTAKINNCKYLSQWSINRHLPKILWGNRDGILPSIQLRNDTFIHRAAYHSKRISLLIKKITQDSYLSTTYLSSTPFFHDRRRAPLSSQKEFKRIMKSISKVEIFLVRRRKEIKGFEVCVIQLYQE